MAFEDDATEVLILEIQARPAIWNKKLPSYKSKHLRDRLYAKVGEILGITNKYHLNGLKSKIENCSNRMNNRMQFIN